MLMIVLGFLVFGSVISFCNRTVDCLLGVQSVGSIGQIGAVVRLAVFGKGQGVGLMQKLFLKISHLESSHLLFIADFDLQFMAFIVLLILECHLFLRLQFKDL